MSLARYHEKRDFSKTPEPRGKEGTQRAGALRYLIQKHDASHLHYDFRLEWQGTLKSWAVPKGPSSNPARKALAVQVEDHPLDYGDFEGVIPEGEYGGGTVLLWDTGTWEPLEDAEDGLKRGKLRFELHGQKLQGQWSLVRMHGSAGGGGKNWLLIKGRDEYADEGDVLKENAQSVKTGRTRDEIREEGDAVWHAKESAEPRERRVAAKNASVKTVAFEGARKGKMPSSLPPQLALLSDAPPEGDKWIHEIKFDGYRLLAFVVKGKATLKTRADKDWTVKFPTVAEALAKWKVDSAIVDGEVVVLNAAGQADFQALQQSIKKRDFSRMRYFVFDLPYCNGADLRKVSLLERKQLLKQVVAEAVESEVIVYSDHVLGDGEEVIKQACALGSEGIVSKRVDGPYASRRDASWLKSKCTKRQEFVIVGWTPSEKRRGGLGALLLGYHDPRRGLIYCGRVGTGFDGENSTEILEKLKKLSRKDPPTKEKPPVREVRMGHWVEPTLVCEVNFAEWTQDGLLRHAAFMGLRADKPAAEVKRELPKKVEAAEQEAEVEIREEGRAMKKAGTKKGAAEGEVEGVRLSHPDKIYYPETGVTKREVAEYYAKVWPWMEHHVVDRPLALMRCPGGIGGKCFFMRNWSENLPEAVGQVNVGRNGAEEKHVQIHEEAGVISLVQVGALEIHTWNSRSVDVAHADQIVFDLDPGPGVTWKQIVESAQILRATLNGLKMRAFLKTSGGKGLHLTVPIEATVEWEQVRAFCKTLATYQAAQTGIFVANMRKDLRGGKVYLDYLRNGHGSTAVAPYSTRSRPGAAVSMPIAWEELADVKSADQFTVRNVVSYLKKRKSDPWADFAKSRVNLQDVAMGDGGEKTSRRSRRKPGNV